MKILENNSFVHLHVHSEYSLLDGACRLKELVRHVKSLGQTAVAVTDHGVMYGAVDFYKEAKEQGIKPIIGCEVYVAPRTRFDKEMNFDSKPYHLVLLCRNNKGYENLVKLVSLGFTEGFYNKPRVDTELLRKHSEGLICLSGCLAGEVARKLANGEYEAAKNTALLYRDIFGEDNYFLEIQNHGIREQLEILPQLLRLSRETGIRLAATNDAHYIEKTDAETQNILLCIQLKKTIFDSNPMKFPTEEFYLKSTAEMAELFKDFPDAVTNTAKIAERCNVEFEFGVIKLPEFKTESSDDNVSYFKKLCVMGLKKRYGDAITEEIKDRLKYELETIIKMGYTDYFLIVWDFIKYAREHDIPVGPGRGSGAGSLCAYCIGITGIDPIKYNLLFERFLNPERVSMPDFDIDFCIEGRQQVIDYVVRKYGEDKVSQIIAFDTLKARAAVKDTGRVLGLSVKFRNDVSSLIPRDLKMTISKALEQSSDLRELYDTNPSAHRLLDESMKLEGMPRNDSIHAAGVVISSVPITDIVPVKKSGDAIVTQYTMTGLEALGLLKMDFLGLRNLTVIKHCTDQIRKTNPGFDINEIPVNDSEVFGMMSKGHTTGVFQFESDGMRRVLSQLKPESLEDLIAVISLYRPGPSESIPKYISNKHNPENVKYKHPLLENILDVTYGCMVYQEQVMEICRVVGGYSYGRADLVRRAMAKKKHDVMEKERQVFVEGAVKNGVSEAVANDIFDEMSSFASYAFNKSHAAAYAYLSYQTAYLKCHYLKEYMAALMSSVFGNTDKLSEYVEECRQNGIEILKPSINRSFSDFVAEKDGIRYGLLAIKGLGKGAINAIISERELSGDYLSLENFCQRTADMNISRMNVENLIKSGCFDGLGSNRREMMSEYEYFMDSYSSSSRSSIEGQMNLFPDTMSSEKSGRKAVRCEEFSYTDMLEFEKLATGMYISGHPIGEHRIYADLLKLPVISVIKKYDGGKNKNDEFGFIGVIDDITVHYTSTGRKMVFADVQDMTGAVSCTVFPDVYEAYKAKIDHGKIVYIRGRISPKDDYELSVICNHIYSDSEFREICKNKRICVKLESSQKEVISELGNLISENTGGTPICYYFTDIKKFLKPKNVSGVNISEEFIRKLTEIVPSEDVGLID